MNDVVIINFAYVYYIAIAMIVLSIAVFTKNKKRRKLAVTTFSVVALYLVFIRYGEKGAVFIKQDLIPLILTAVALVIGYFILDFIDKKFPEKEEIKK